MHHAPTLGSVTKNHSANPGALCCLLFAPPFSKTAREGIVPRIAYLHHRSYDKLDFHCAGYGGYLHQSNYPDLEKIAEITHEDGAKIPWSFSDIAFTNFVNDFERISNWKYSGESEIVLLENIKSLDDCLVLDIDKMIDDKVISRASELFESLIQYAITNSGESNSTGYSDSKVAQIFTRSVIDFISNGPGAIGRTLTIGRHFATKNLSRKK